MGKIIVNFFFVILFSFLLEGCLYINDLNEVYSLNNYIKYDLNNTQMGSVINDKYEVSFEETEHVIKYVITYKRDSILNIEKFKKIIYYGEVVKINI